MGDKTGIEWTDATWSPLIGCRRVSEGCRHCYAERQAIRIARYKGIVESTPNGPRWTGASRLVVEALDQPLRWKRPRRVFVDSMADLFFEGHSNEDIAAVFGVMAAAPQHTFQILTKRPARMREWFAWCAEAFDNLSLRGALRVAAVRALGGQPAAGYKQPGFVSVAPAWPLPNVWLGVSAENQATADERIPLLLETPAAIRFVSYEPALGPVTFPFQLWRCACGWSGTERALDMRGQFSTCPACGASGGLDTRDGERLSWLIAGSESGPGARPAELEWFRSVRDQCAAAGVAFFFKQWVGRTSVGAISPVVPEGWVHFPGDRTRKVSLPVLDGRQHVEWPR